MHKPHNRFHKAKDSLTNKNKNAPYTQIGVKYSLIIIPTCI